MPITGLQDFSAKLYRILFSCSGESLPPSLVPQVICATDIT